MVMLWRCDVVLVCFLSTILPSLVISLTHTDMSVMRKLLASVDTQSNQSNNHASRVLQIRTQSAKNLYPESQESIEGSEKRINARQAAISDSISKTHRSSRINNRAVSESFEKGSGRSDEEDVEFTEGNGANGVARHMEAEPSMTLWTQAMLTAATVAALAIVAFVGIIAYGFFQPGFTDHNEITLDSGQYVSDKTTSIDTPCV